MKTKKKRELGITLKSLAFLTGRMITVKSYCRLWNIKGGGESSPAMQSVRHPLGIQTDIESAATEESGNSEIHFGKSTI